MILKWNSKVTFNNKTRVVERTYEVLDLNNQIIAKANAVDNHSLSLKDGPCKSVLNLNSKNYWVKSIFKFRCDWFIVDENQNTILTLHPSEEAYMKKKKKFFSKEIIEVESHMYVDELTINGRTFYLYFVCLGKGKQYIVIHENGNVVSEIHIYDSVINYARCQDMYCVDDETVVNLTIMYCYMYNVYFNWTPDESVIHNNGCFNEVKSKNTNEHLLSKFSQEFIDRIIAESQME